MLFKRIKFKLINTYLFSSRMGLFRVNETTNSNGKEEFQLVGSEPVGYFELRPSSSWRPESGKLNRASGLGCE